MLAARADVATLPPGPVRAALERFVSESDGGRDYVETLDLRRRPACT